MSDKPIHEDLPDEIAEKILRILPDFGINGDAYLWDLNGVCIGVERVVEGNYPMDFYTREEQAFATEAEALRAAESFRELAV